MSDAFQITPPTIRAEGKDVPPEQIQAGFNSLARQTQIGLNSVATDPTGPASGDLGGMYPAPTVVAVHAIGGTLDGVAIGSTTPSTGAFTTLTATTPVAVTSGGTGQNALNAHNVLIGEGSSAVGFAAPGTAGQMLISAGAALDPAFGGAPTITGGSINNAPIGQTTPAAGNFTTLAASTAVTVPSGGTGRGTLTTHGVLIGEGTSAINQTTAGTTGQMLLGVTGADPAFGNNPTITGGTIDGAVVGGTTRAAGHFTTLDTTTAIGVASGGTGATTLTAHGVLIGEGTGNVAVAGPGTTGQMLIGVTGADPAFGNTVSTLTATNTITPNSLAGIVGTTTNDNANAGSIGEYVTATGTGVSLTTATPANIASVSLTAGDWDVWGNITWTTAGGAAATNLISSVNNVSATTAASPMLSQFAVAYSANSAASLIAPQQRFSLSATTTIFLVANQAFAGGTCTGAGYIAARRRR